ncbi:MAG TPA: YcdB/YcdC domain-containing protein [Desulfitobacterium sp.]|nr:YcdB/YcdC domain-containing protein [Desulfitobacterium sp.]
MFRKLVFPMAFVFLAQTIVPIPALGAEARTGIIAATAKTDISLEQAIASVKQNFEVPKEFDQFTSGFNSYNNRQSWSLNWSKPDQDGGSFSAQVDVNSGEILSTNYWKNTLPAESGFNLPKISYTEAKETAQQLVNKMLASRLGELEYVPQDSRVIPLNNYGPVTYSFQWKRMVNGIPFPSNAINVQVHGGDGRVTSYNVNWSSEDLLSAQGVIGDDKARQSFSEHKLLQLQYYVPQMIRPLAANTKGQARLVYQSTPSDNAMIDALTGEPVTLEKGQWLAGDGLAYDNGGYGGEAKSSGQQPALTPEEAKEVEKTAQMITQEQAVEFVKKWVTIPDSLTLRNANLGMDGSYRPNQVWTLDWNSAQQGKEGVQYVSARLDAVTGELLAFNTAPQVTTGTEKMTPIDRATAQKLVEEFLNKIQPQHLQDVKLVEGFNGAYKGLGEGSTMQEFNYQRVVNGIVFPSNGMTVMVDTFAKTITNYNLNWWTLDFPDPSEGMIQSNAEEKFLQARPLELNYVQIYNPSGLGEIRLVYQPSLDNVLARSNIMDAKAGQFLDWQGQALVDLPHPYYFKDIAGKSAEKEISLLGQAGIFGENKEQFKPDDTLTVTSLLKAMIIAKNGAWQNINLKDEEVLQKAKELGWWEEDLSPTAGVSRELMAKLQIRILNLENIAQIPSLFQSPYKDVKVDNPAVGYVALVKGLGLMKIDGADFEPGRVMTRAEGAYALVETLGVKW